MVAMPLVEVLRCELIRQALTPGVSQASVADLLVTRASSIVGFAACGVYVLDRYGRLQQLVIRASDPGTIIDVMPPIDKSFARGLLENWTDDSPYASEVVRAEGDVLLADVLASYYGSALGEVRSLVRIPLNGSSRTFGFVDAINVPESFTDSTGSSFSWIDAVERIKLLAIVGASAITVWRARQEAVTLADLTEALKDVSLHDSAGDWWGQARVVSTAALERLAAQVGTFRAAVIRVRKGDLEVLEVLAKHADPEISWDRWRDLPLNPKQSLAGEAYFLGSTDLPAKISTR